MAQVGLMFQSGAGIIVMTALAWALSTDRSKVEWRLAAMAIGIQILLAVVLLQLPVARQALLAVTPVIEAIQAATAEGASFVFGYLATGPLPFEVTNPEANLTILAIQVLPLVVVVSALSALLWHWRILQVVIRLFALVLQKTLGIGGAAGLGTAANVYMGMIEAPLFIRAYLSRLSQGELFMLMTVGLATISGTVLVLYANLLEPSVPGAVAHILTASLISVPAAVMMARIMVPGGHVTPADLGTEALAYEGSMDAVVQGTREGLSLLLTITAILLVMVALVTLADSLLALLPGIDGAPMTLRRIFGWVFAPLVWLFGVPWSEAAAAGALMGTKTILNEFFAYLDLAALPQDTLSPRSRVIMLYAMCGFANLGSVGMLISTIGTLVPERRSEVAALGLRALIAGTLATGMTGAVVGLLPQ
ncbi:MAG: NupC/NupG family nucleoside CNT transporter [Alphaproteobacteria bacterium]